MADFGPADFREANGLTQAELAARLGISQGHLSKIESGHHRAGVKLREKIRTLTGRDDVAVWAARVEAAARRSPEFRELVDAAMKIMRSNAS